jgi:hypothetical protein
MQAEPGKVIVPPTTREEYVVWHRHPNRAMRRHPDRYPMLYHRNKDGEYVLKNPMAGKNRPYEKSTD